MTTKTTKDEKGWGSVPILTANNHGVVRKSVREQFAGYESLISRAGVYHQPINKC